MTKMTTQVSCIYCNEFKEIPGMQQVFQTGFTFKQGLHFPLGVCKQCYAEREGKQDAQNDNESL